jgi:hypothetical protein
VHHLVSAAVPRAGIVALETVEVVDWQSRAVVVGLVLGETHLLVGPGEGPLLDVAAATVEQESKSVMCEKCCKKCD